MIAGIALDALELVTAMQTDLADADGKLGKVTLSAAASISGRWAGGIAGAKAGAAAGAVAGSVLIPIPVVGTAIGAVAGGLILGITGATAGGALGEWIVDITYVEEIFS